MLPAIALMELSIPILTPTVGSIARQAHDFAPSPTPTALPTSTNVFSPVKSFVGLVIRLDRTFCFGSCPDYEVTVSGNGTGVYEGRGSVRTIGLRHFDITEAQLKELVEAFESEGYFSLKEGYGGGVTDLETVTIYISFQGLTKEVESYGGCWEDEESFLSVGVTTGWAPPSFCNLADKIDQILNTSQWTGQ